MSPPPPAARRLLTPALWRPRDRVVAGLLLGLALEAVTAAFRFGLAFRSTRDTAALAPFTFGLRVHHGYVGVLMLLAAAVVRWPRPRRWLVVAGVALAVSDLLHHFAVLWPLTGSPEFDLVYPGGVRAPDVPWGWLWEPAFWAGVLLGAEWGVRLVALAVVPVSRPPAAAAAWMLTIFLFPWVGSGLFLLIGSPRMPRWRRDKLGRFAAAVAPVLDKARAAVPGPGAEVPGPLAPVARLAGRLGQFPVVGGSRVEFLADYDGTLARLAADVDRARDHVHLVTYIAAADAATEPVLGALARAAGRGVRCRLLYDAQGSWGFSRRLRARLAGTGVDARPALPVRWLPFRGTRADLRNHRKVAVVDGAVGYVGSQNLIDKGFKRGVEYEEFVARVEGPLVPQLQLVFAADWWQETDELLADPGHFPPPGAPGTAVGQVLPSGPDFPTENFQRVLVDAVYQALRQVTVVTPYLVPDDALLQALETAVHRGVRVRVVVSETTDQAFVRWCQESYYAELLADGVEVLRYKGRFLHAKHATVDDGLAVVGSGNADVRSFRLNSEASLLLYDPGSVAGVAARQEQYVANAERLSAAGWAARPRWRRLPENLARIWSPLL